MSAAKSLKINASRIFFPAAAIYASYAVILSLVARYTTSGFASGLIGVGHAHEMLFGFVLALIAGYTLGAMSSKKLWSLFALWLTARLGFVFFPSLWISQLLSPLFALYLALLVFPRFQAAKKWRNKMISPLIFVICCFPLFWLTLKILGWPISHSSLYISTILLLSLLMSFMGGRMIAPAAAGECYKKGYELKARVQPRLEGFLIVLFPITALITMLNVNQTLTGVLIVIIAVTNMVRLLRWQLWRCMARFDLIGLGFGYAWLSLGLFILGATIILKQPTTAAIHLITIGAIGCLSICVMARLHYQKNVKTPPPKALIVITLSLISLSAISRYASEIYSHHYESLLWVSAFSWAAAMLWLALHIIKKTKTYKQA